MPTQDLDTQLKQVQIQKEKIKAGLLGGCALIIAAPLVLILGVIVIFALAALFH